MARGVSGKNKLAAIITVKEQTGTDNKKPIFLKIISGVLILAGISGMYSNYMLESGYKVGNERFQDYLESRTLIDQISPYVLSALLILSALYMFKGKLRSVRLFLWYIILTSVATLAHVLLTSWYEYYGMSGITATTVSMSITVAIYFYLRNLRKKGILVE